MNSNLEPAVRNLKILSKQKCALILMIRIETTLLKNFGPTLKALQSLLEFQKLFT